MLFYFLVLGVTFFLLELYMRTKSVHYYWLGILVLWCVCAFRFDVGMDFAQFYEMEVPPLDEITLLPEGDEFNRFGIATKLVYLLADWCGWRQLVIVISSSITLFFFASAIKRDSPDPFLSWAVFVAFLLSPSFNMIWQMVAMSLVFYAFRYVQKRNLALFLLWIVLASLFHITAVLSVLIYPLFRHVRLKWIIIGGVCGWLVVSFAVELLSALPHFSSYVEEMDKYPGGKKLIVLYPLMLVCSSIAWFLWGKGERSEFLRVVGVVTAGVFPMGYFGPHVGNRIGFYYTMFLILLVPMAVGLKWWISRIAGVGFISLFFLTIYLYRQSDEFCDTHVPYRCCFCTDTSFFRERVK